MVSSRVVTNSRAATRLTAIEPRFITVNALPPNLGMQVTAKSVTPFAFAKAAPLSSAADPRRYAQ